MSKDKLEGLMIGIGAGVLVAAFMRFSEDQAKHADEAIEAETGAGFGRAGGHDGARRPHVRAFAAETASGPSELIPSSHIT
jgi:hypothetical protein